MKKIILCSFAAIGVLIFIAVYCASPQDPRKEPGNAKITAFKTNFPGGDTVSVPWGWIWIANRCTLDIQLPELTDSLIIKRKVVDSIVLDTTLSAADTQFCFSFTSHRFGRDTLVAYIIRKDGAGNDTVLKPYFSPHLFFRISSIGHPAACPIFDTIWADTCAYDRDSVNNPYCNASNLNWPQDTIHGKLHLWRMVRVRDTFCFYNSILGITICNYSHLSRKWVVQWDDIFMHLCAQTGIDTLNWTVINNVNSILKDTVTEPLVLHRP